MGCSIRIPDDVQKDGKVGLKTEDLLQMVTL
jgi:hypothetical protein